MPATVSSSQGRCEQGRARERHGQQPWSWPAGDWLGRCNRSELLARVHDCASGSTFIRHGRGALSIERIAMSVE
jgi:hypothetical protein